jgi:16S rRNA (guanine527-N7)-methyltransferase
VQHTRVEDIKDKKFDIVVSRAVSSIKDLWFWSKPLLKKKPINQPKKINGLICLKGGNLSQEIAESGCHPRIWEIDTIFDEVFFKEKYILLIPS